MNHPGIQVKLREHLHSALGHVQPGECSVEDVAPEKTPYLEALVHETLRVARIAVGVARRSKAATPFHDEQNRF